jgi:hypothetical protein
MVNDREDQAFRECIIEWLTTEPNPRSPTTGFDAGQVGWKLHAVYCREGTTFGEIGRRPALCGLRPRWGWSLDMFIDERCKRCVRKYETRTSSKGLPSE